MASNGVRPALGVWTALVLVALYAPIVVMAVFSFNAGQQVVVWKGFTLDWYRKALANADAREAFLDTMTIALGSTLIATVLGTCAAVAGVRLSFPGKRAFNLIASLPISVPDVLMGFSLFVFFLILGAGFGHWTVIVAHATFSMAYVAVVVSARLQAVDASLELAAQDLGATPFRAFLRVTLPAIAPAVAAGALLAFTLSLDDVVITYFTTSPRVTTLPVYLYSRVRFQFTPEVNALSTMMLAASVLLVVAARKLHRPSLTGDGK